MRIAIASSGLGHVARGIESWATDLARALDERGEAVVLCKGGGRAERDYERVVPCFRRRSPANDRVLRGLPGWAGWRFGIASPYGVEQTTFAMGLLGRLREHRVDILHVQDAQVARIVQEARRLGWVRTRTILAHATEESPEFLRKIVYLQHLAPAHLEEAKAAGTWRSTWTAIPNFIDTELFRPGAGDEARRELGIPPGAPIVLSVAAIKRDHKRVDHLVREFARMLAGSPGSAAHLVVAGGREAETDGVIAEGEALLGDRVRFLVDCPRARMSGLYRAADAFALCSVKEMMPIALLEATSSGLPCVVSNHPVVTWMAGPGGESVDMEAAGALASALARLLEDPTALARRGLASRRHCLANFDRDRVVDQVLDYYRFVGARGRRAAAPDSQATAEHAS